MAIHLSHGVPASDQDAAKERVWEQNWTAENEAAEQRGVLTPAAGLVRSKVGEFRYSPCWFQATGANPSPQAGGPANRSLSYRQDLYGLRKRKKDWLVLRLRLAPN